MLENVGKGVTKKKKKKKENVGKELLKIRNIIRIFSIHI